MSRSVSSIGHSCLPPGTGEIPALASSYKKPILHFSAHSIPVTSTGICQRFEGRNRSSQDLEDGRVSPSSASFPSLLTGAALWFLHMSDPLSFLSLSSLSGCLCYTLSNKCLAPKGDSKADLLLPLEHFAHMQETFSI